MSWKSIVADGCVSFPRKGTRIRIEPHLYATNASLAGMMDKIGAESQEEVIGIMRHVYGDSVVEPTRVELHVETESGMKIVKMPGASLLHVQVES